MSANDKLRPPELLDFISNYSQPQPKGLRYRMSMASSIGLHSLALYLLILYPHILIYKREWFSGGSASAENAEKQYEVINYVPTSNKPMYAPYRRPEGNLYSSQDSLAISRPPRPIPGGNLQPYSRGTTKELLITDVVKKLDNASAADKAKDSMEAASSENKAPVPGTPPAIEIPTTDQIPSATALIAPPKPKDPKEQIGVPDAQPAEKAAVDKTTTAARDSEARQRVAEDIAKQLKMADIGQKIFENEASALRSEGSGFFDTKGFELSGYSQYVIDKIKEHWLIPAIARDNSGRSTVIFYIERDGQISGLRLVAPSGHRVLDSAALNSILVANPFPPLPQNFTGEHIGAKLVFSYNEIRNP